MNKIFTFLTVFLTVSFGYAQTCLDPIADAEQYFCTVASVTLDDLDVDPVSGTLAWFEDEALTSLLGGTTPVIDGETYYVLNDCGVDGTSDAVPITVYEQSVEFVVSPDSCINLGKNVFFIEEDDLINPVEIEVLNLDGNLFDEALNWSPIGANEFEFYFPGAGWDDIPSGGSGQMPQFGLIYNTIRTVLEPFDLLELDLGIPVGNSGCMPSEESITIIAGGLEYKDFCYGDTKTIQDIVDYYTDILGDDYSVYDASSDGSLLNTTDVIQEGETYFLEFGQNDCSVRIPVTVNYKVDAPIGREDYLFCSQEAWSKIGINDGQKLDDVVVQGDNLTWYDENFDEVSDPDQVYLEDGDVYYVTNIVDGCESAPLKMEFTMTECGCIEDPDFSSDSLDGFNFFTIPVVPNACNMGYVNNATPISLGSVNGMGGNVDNAVKVTDGFDPTLLTHNIELPRTSPFSDGSTSAMRLNKSNANGGSANIIMARKEFVAGEVFAFDFAAVLQDPSHDLHDQPFFQVNIYDEEMNIIQTRCIVSDINDCIFNKITIGTFDDILYSDWSSIKLDTRAIQGEAAMVEFFASWCAPTAHYGYTYIDNVFVGTDADSEIHNPAAEASFGYMEIYTLDNGTNIYQDCSYMEMNEGEMCEAILPALNPDFDIIVYGKLDEPQSAQTCVDPLLNNIQLDVIKNGTTVGTVPNSTGSLASLNWALDASLMPSQMYGYYTLQGVANYTMNDGAIGNDGNSVEYEYEVIALNSGFKICPIASCLDDLTVCLEDGATEYEMDLTELNEDVLQVYDEADHSDYQISFYNDLDDAMDKSNSISQPSQASFLAGTHTVYVRVDYDWAKIGLSEEEDCYDIISFDIIVSSTPVLPDDNPIELDDVCELEGEDGAFFDLEDTTLIDAILDNVTVDVDDHEVYFYPSSSDASNDTNRISDTDEYLANVGTTIIHVRIESPAGCYSTMEIELTVNPLPTLLDTNITIPACEDGSGNGQGAFDLPVKIDNEIADPTNGYTITYYNDEVEAENGDQQDAITNPGTYIGEDGEVIYIRVEDPNTGCAITTEATLEVVDAPTVPPLTPLEVCDDGNGQAEFNLGGLRSYIQDGSTSLDVDFYGSQQDADDQNAPLPNLHTSGNTTIFVRVGASGLDCPAIVQLDLIVNENPVLPTTPIVSPLCENEDGSDVEFDLSSSTLSDAVLADVTGNEADYEIEFYNSQTAAENADANSQIDETVPYPVPGTTQVWVRVIDITQSTECFSVISVTLTVNPLPTINSPKPLRECDPGAGNGLAEFDLSEATIDMVGLGSNYTVTYYIDQNNAEAATGALPVNYTNTTAYNQVIYARIEDNSTACHIVEPITLEVLDAPLAQDAELVYCDPNNDGEGTFHLPDADADITSDPNAAISYHRTQADADNDVNPLPDTVTNNMINNQQYIYVRVEVAGVGCHTVVKLKLTIEETPELVTPSEVFIGCDEDGTGVHVFDLEEIVEEEVTILLNDPTDYDITYFETDSNGDKAAQISSPSAYPSSGGIVIVVVTNPLTECATEVEIELFVAPLPEVFTPLPLELCDVNNPGDEVEEFYLDEAIAEITDGDTSLSVSFHETQADADTGDNPLAIPYENTENNQTIYIRVENEYGCVVTDTITLTLVVNPLPEPVTPEPLEVCDVDNEGVAYFDLESLENEIIANEPDVSISFHETYSNAENGLWPLASPYQNIVLNEQIIYARVENDTTGCFTIVEVILRVMPTPVVPTELDDLYFCTPDVDTGVRINITGYEDVIYGLQDRDALDLTYHLSEQDARANNAPIADPTDFLLNPPTPTTIYVRLAYKDGDCYSIVSFVLHLVEGPQINDPTPLSLCMPYGDANNETAVFDLLEKREEIIGNATGLGIYFYEEESDALAGNGNYITDPANYTNIENPQDIYIRVVDSQENEDDSGCVAFTTLTLRVDPNPEPVVPDAIEVCHLDNDADATIVDLTIRELQILNQESWDLEYYEKYRDAVNGNQEQVIANPEEYELDLEDSPMIIYVRVINPETGCFEIVELEIVLSTLPDVLPPEAIEPMIVCTTDGSGRAVFDLTEKLPEIFGNQNLDGLEVFFYEDLDDAIDGINPIIDPDTFTNRETPQTIYVGVGNPEIDDCYIGGLTYFEIEVLEGAEAFRPEESYKVCGVAGPEGGVGSFDLRDESLIDTILGLQSPDFFDVDFYLTEEEAEEAEPGTALQSPYENITNPQVIYARVENQDTGCYAIAEVTLEVIVLEDLILEDLYSFCTDANGNPMEDADGNIIFPIIDTGLNADDNEFTWYYEGERIIGQVGPSLEADQIGAYTVEIINHTTGCTLSLDIQVVESSMPFNYGAEVTSPAFSGTYNVEAWAEGFGDYWFSIDGGAEQDHGSFTNVGIGSHVITITDRNGCGSVDVIVNVVDYPKFFTPNDDGYNDTWNIPGMAELDPSAEIFIFDRHGKLLKQLNPLSEGWDGTFNGKALPSTDYWFVVKYMEDGAPREFKGHFSLKR